MRQGRSPFIQLQVIEASRDAPFRRTRAYKSTVTPYSLPNSAGLSLHDCAVYDGSIKGRGEGREKKKEREEGQNMMMMRRKRSTRRR